MELLAAVDLYGFLIDARNFLYVALGLGLVIFFHELGHFAVAKMCDVYVERFSIGFGRPIWSRHRGETEYALGWLPFGGYVKMLGQDDMEPGQMTSEEIAEDPRSYSAKSVPQRMAIISAGVIMNVITGMLFFAFAFRHGVMSPPPVAGLVLTGSPAWIAGIEQGDTITQIDGKPMHSFVDITLAVALSTGDIDVEGERRNGSPFDVTITPDSSGTRRTIGVGPQNGLSFAPAEAEVDPNPPGTPGAEAEPPFLPGDSIVGIGGEKVESFSGLVEELSRRRAEELDFEVQRATGETETIHVGTSNFRSLGLWMDIGQIEVIRSGSPAERAGMQVGDKILKVDGQQVGIDIDALRLPDYFAERHGESVAVEITRQESGGGATTASLDIVPEDRTGWTERPMRPDDPLSIPAIGAAYPVVSRIVKVAEGSPAAVAEILDNQTVVKIEYIARVDGPDDGYKKQVEELELFETSESGSRGKPANWAYAFWILQQMPERAVKVTIADAETETEKVVDLTPERVADWYLPIRGLRLQQSMSMQKANSLTEAS